jgi:ATP/ADP translocase
MIRGGDDDPRKPVAVDGEVFEDAPANQGLLSGKRKTLHSHYQHGKILDPHGWMRPYWLGSGLFLILFAFWLLDSLKDPIFVKLVDGKISQHQPLAKLCSVLVTLVLVCLLEFGSNLLQQRKREARIRKENEVTPAEEILDPGGVWKRIQMKTAALSSTSSTSNHEEEASEHAVDDIVSFDIFYYIGIPYMAAFFVLSYFVWRFEQRDNQRVIITTTTSIQPSPTLTGDDEENPLGYYILGYILYATVESFGSLAVATFWSYTNSTLSLHDAENYYGPIIATAQLGAIGGSTLVATGRWDSSNLLTVVALTIVLQLLLMRAYDQRFEPTSLLISEQQSSFDRTVQHHRNHNSCEDDDATILSIMTPKDGTATRTKPFLSGLYLIFNHSYVLLILGVSCLYEVAMTLLDYQMKLLGFARFRDDVNTTTEAMISNTNNSMSFTKFMGHYGQLVNVTSLLFSSLLFPYLIRRLGLRRTLMWFPTMLLVVTFLAYGALPGNLAVLFVSLSLLKAMTYSIHDPSKELLYIPTSNAIKFRAKFWIDVVGERISKAIGSAFNTLAKNIEQSVKIGTFPSLLSAAGLWLVCYYVGKRFDDLLATGKIIGLERSIDPSTYSRVSRREENGGDENDSYHGRNYESYRDYYEEPSEVEISFDDDNVSTLDLMADPVASPVADMAFAGGRTATRETTGLSRIEMPPLSRI